MEKHDELDIDKLDGLKSLKIIDIEKHDKVDIEKYDEFDIEKLYGLKSVKIDNSENELYKILFPFSELKKRKIDEIDIEELHGVKPIKNELQEVLCYTEISELNKGQIDEIESQRILFSSESIKGQIDKIDDNLNCCTCGLWYGYSYNEDHLKGLGLMIFDDSKNIICSLDDYYDSKNFRSCFGDNNNESIARCDYCNFQLGLDGVVELIG